MKRLDLSLELVRQIQTDCVAGQLENQARRNQVRLGRLPEAMLAALNIPDLELVTSIAIIEKMIFDHGLVPSVIASLHDLICTPTGVYKSATKADSIVVLTMQLTRNLPVIAAIKVDTPDSYMKPNMHWLASAYPKDHQEMIGQWKKQGLLLWTP